jgi:hypothetical protein
LPPSRRASERPMAMACLRLLTRLPERPERSSPRFISCIAPSTFSFALSPYLREPLDREVELRDFRLAGAFDRADELLLERPPELLLERPLELLLARPPELLLARPLELLLARPPELLLARPPELLLARPLEPFVLRFVLRFVFVFVLEPDVPRPLLLLDVPRRIAMRRDSATSVPAARHARISEHRSR